MIKYKFNGRLYKDRDGLGKALDQTCGIERQCEFYDPKLNQCIFGVRLDDDETKCKCDDAYKMFS